MKRTPQVSEDVSSSYEETTPATNNRRSFLTPILILILILILVGVAGYYLRDSAFAATYINKYLDRQVTSGLVGYWTFDGANMNLASGTAEVLDASGNGNNANWQNHATTTEMGKFGQAIRFDGVDDVVATVPVTLTPASGRTFSAWFKIDTTASEVTLLSHSDTLIRVRTDGSIRFYWTGGAYHYSSGFTILPNVWYHIVGIETGDGPTNFKLYLNGVKYLDEDDPFGHYGAGYASLSVGAGFPGLVDDVRVYNRALSQKEITRLYNLGEGTKVNQTALKSNLVAWYRFEGNSNTFADASGNQGIATINGAVGKTVGKIGGALSYPGSAGDYVAITGGSQPSYPYSISLWFKADVLSGALISYGAGNTTIALTGSYMHLAGSGDANHLGALASNFRTGEWYHIVATYPSASTKKLYINGVDKTTATDDWWESCGFQVANRNGCGGNSLPFDGIVDDIRVYNKVLSPEEVQDVYRDLPSYINTTATTTVSNGLVGYWTFDGNNMSGTSAYDISGSHATGTLTNGADPTMGKIGQGISFDGVDDSVVISPARTTTNTFTITAWIKPNGGGSQYQTIFGLNDSNSFQYENNTRKQLFIVNGGWNLSQTQLKQNSWNFATVVVSGGTGTYYLNGRSDGATVSGITTRDYSMIGNNASGERFSGSIDDVRIYNRALSADEVQLLYNSGR